VGERTSQAKDQVKGCIGKGGEIGDRAFEDCLDISADHIARAGNAITR
jgi:hypothetical protein